MDPLLPDRRGESYREEKEHSDPRGKKLASVISGPFLPKHINLNCFKLTDCAIISMGGFIGGIANKLIASSLPEKILKKLIDNDESLITLIEVLIEHTAGYETLSFSDKINCIGDQLIAFCTDCPEMEKMDSLQKDSLQKLCEEWKALQFFCISKEAYLSDPIQAARKIFGNITFQDQTERFLSMQASCNVAKSAVLKKLYKTLVLKEITHTPVAIFFMPDELQTDITFLEELYSCHPDITSVFIVSKLSGRKDILEHFGFEILSSTVIKGVELAGLKSLLIADPKHRLNQSATAPGTNFRCYNFKLPSGVEIKIGAMSRHGSTESTFVRRNQTCAQVSDQLYSEGFRKMISLDEQDSDEIEAEWVGHLGAIRESLFIDDTGGVFRVEDFKHLYHSIKSSLCKEEDIIIHCAEGLGRSGVVLAAIQMQFLYEELGNISEISNPIFSEPNERKYIIELGYRNSCVTTPVVAYCIGLIKQIGRKDIIESARHVESLEALERALIAEYVRQSKSE